MEVTRTARRLYAIQALRFLAVLGVMLHHSLNGSFGRPLTHEYVGSAGVDLFFVISGVVIGYVDHDDGVGPFAIKRLIRVVPLYWISTIAYLAWRCLAFHDHFGTTRILTSFLLTPTTARSWTPIYYPGWSLVYELTFYTLFGCLLPLVRGRTAQLAALIAFFLAAQTFPAPLEPGAFLDSKPFLEFGAGLVIAEALRRGALLPRRLAIAAIVLAVVGFAFAPMPTEPRALTWGLPSILLVLGALSLDDATFFRNRWVGLLGDASYSIYLTHITVMEMLVHQANLLGIDLESRIRFVLLRETVLLSVALLVGVAVHLWIEKPMLRLMRQVALRPRRTAYERHPARPLEAGRAAGTSAE